MRSGGSWTTLTAGTIVIFSAFTHDAAKHVFSLEDSARFVYAHTPAPVYSMSRPALGLGIIGGKMTDGYEHGKAAAQMAVAVLRAPAHPRSGSGDRALTRTNSTTATGPPAYPALGTAARQHHHQPAKIFLRCPPGMGLGRICFVLLQSSAILALTDSKPAKTESRRGLRTHTDATGALQLHAGTVRLCNGSRFPGAGKNSSGIHRTTQPQIRRETGTGSSTRSAVCVGGIAANAFDAARLLAWVRAVDISPSSSPVSESAEVIGSVIECHGRDRAQAGHDIHRTASFGTCIPAAFVRAGGPSRRQCFTAWGECRAAHRHRSGQARQVVAIFSD